MKFWISYNFREEDENSPEGWKVKGEENQQPEVIKQLILGEEGVNTPTASLRNRIKIEDELE